MNEVVINEMDKNYNIECAFSRSGGVNTDISAVTARNEKINLSEIISFDVADFKSRLVWFP